MNLRFIRLIAANEARTQIRSAVFVILFCLTLGGIFYVQAVYQGNTPMGTWQNMALASFIPWLNATLFTVIQILGITFMTCDSWNRWQRLATLETLKVHPVSHAEWFIGKAWGIVKVLLRLNLLSIIVALFINLFCSDVPLHVGLYIFYFLTLSLPVLIFYLGFTLLVESLVKNQGITLFIVCLFAGVTSGILREYAHGMGDVVALTIPNVFSQMVGHVNLGRYLLHQAGYLSLGIGFFLLAVNLFPRIPNKQYKEKRYPFSGYTLCAIGCFMLCGYSYMFLNEKQNRQDYRHAHEKVADQPNMHVKQHFIDLELQGETMHARSSLVVCNSTKQHAEKILLFLNPALEIRSMEIDNQQVSFSRNHQVILVDRSLVPKEEITLKITYEGSINEQIAYLDIADQLFYQGKTAFQTFRLGKHYVFLKKDFTLLTPEIMWYPTSCPPVNPLCPFATEKDFTLFSLNLPTEADKEVISQGNYKEKNGRIYFEHTSPLPGISLCKGKFKKKEIEINGINVALYYWGKQPFFAPYLNAILTTDIENIFIKSYAFRNYPKYPTDKLRLVETPISFTSYHRLWKDGNTFSQPEILFWPERGAAFTMGCDFRRMTDIYKKNMPQKTTRERQINLLNYFINGTISQENLMHTNEKQKSVRYEKNLYWLYPLFLLPSKSNLTSKTYPAFDLLIQTILKNEENKSRSPKSQMITDEFIKAIEYLKEHSFNEALQTQALDPTVILSMIDMKAKDLLHYLSAHVPRKEVLQLLKDAINQSNHSYSLQDVITLLNEKTGKNVQPFLETLYHGKQLPQLIVQGSKFNHVFIDQESLIQNVYIHLQNPTTVDAVVKVEAAQPEEEKCYIIPAKTSKTIKYICQSPQQTVKLYMGTSYNIPHQISITKQATTSISEDRSEGVFDYIPQATETQQRKEIIVDNEDDGFEIITPRYIRWTDKIQKETTNTLHHAHRWAKHYNHSYFGKCIKSIHYKMGGQGNYKACWHVDQLSQGVYDVFVKIPPINYGFGSWQTTTRAKDYTLKYTVTEGNTEREVILNLSSTNSQNGWFFLGRFNINGGSAKITLSDYGKEQQIIVADAIKWVKVEK